jgi:hypothetical protein
MVARIQIREGLNPECYKWILISDFASGFSAWVLQSPTDQPFILWIVESFRHRATGSASPK